MEAELQARRDSGEFDRFMEEAEKARKQQAIDDINFARKMRKVIAGYLVISALYAFSGITINASSTTVSGVILALFAILLAATFAGGVGLFLNKPWGHWAAVTVLALQVVKIQVAGFAFSLLSLIGIYVYVAGDGSIGVSANFDPGFQISIDSAGMFWLGINIFVLPMIVYLFTAREDVPDP